MNRRFNRGIIGAYHITLAGTLFLGHSPSTSPGSSRLILYHNAPHTGHAFKSSYAPAIEDAVIRACMYLLHLQSCRAIRYSLEASSSIFSVASQILCQVHHSLPSTAAIQVWYRALCCHLRNWGTTF